LLLLEAACATLRRSSHYFRTVPRQVLSRHRQIELFSTGPLFGVSGNKHEDRTVFAPDGPEQQRTSPGQPNKQEYARFGIIGKLSVPSLSNNKKKPRAKKKNDHKRTRRWKRERFVRGFQLNPIAAYFLRLGGLAVRFPFALDASSRLSSPSLFPLTPTAGPVKIVQFDDAGKNLACNCSEGSEDERRVAQSARPDNICVTLHAVRNALPNA